MVRKSIAVAAVVGLAFGSAACDDDDPVGPTATADARLGIVASTQDANPSQPGITFVGVGGQVVTLTQVELVVSELELDPVNDDDTEEFETGPVAVNLALDGSVVTAVEAPLPAGSFDELEMEIEFVRLVGTVDGEAFNVLVDADTELELEFDDPLVVVANQPVNLMIGIDLASLFVTDAGLFLDPRLLLTSETLREQLSANFEAAFEAFEDEDFDGDDDDDD